MHVYNNLIRPSLLPFEWLQVSPGMNCDFAQDVVVVNQAEKGCGIIGELNKRAIITPDVDSILASIDGL